MASGEGEIEFRQILSPGTETQIITGPTIASAVSFVPGAWYLQPVSGTAAIATIGLPYPGFSGSLNFRPTAIFTFVTGGTPTAVQKAIALAGSAVV
jgi:hypothetical protein